MKTRKNSFILLFLILSVSCLFGIGSKENEVYPVKAIEIMVPGGAGGSTDISARNLASVLPKYLGESVVVVAKSGGGGQVGMDYLSKKRADGYSIGLSTIGAWNIYPAMHSDAVFSYSNFKNIARIEIAPAVLVVRPSSEYSNFEEFTSFLKNNPKALKYGIASFGSISELGIKSYMSVAGITVENTIGVPFAGTGEATLAILGDHVDFMYVNLAPIHDHIRSGNLIALAVSTPDRLKGFPEVPTFKEVGYETAGISGWKGVAVPSDVPDSVVETLNSAIKKAVNDPEWIEMQINLGVIPAYLNAADTEEFIEKEFKAFKKLVNK